MDQLEKDVLNLKESMDILASIINEQQDSIDTLENFIEQSKETVKESKEDIKDSSTYTTTYITGGILCLLYFLIF